MALRDKLLAEETNARDLAARLAEAESRVEKVRDDNERHIVALQRALEVTRRERREEAKSMAGGDGGDVDNIGSVVTVGALFDWLIATVEGHFLEWQAQIDADKDR